MTRRRPGWAALLVVVAVSLGVAATGAGTGAPRTEAERVDALSERVRCPTCQGLSAAESDAAAAVAVREEIGRRVAAGESDGEVLAFLASRYGEDILLTPPRTGVAALVWALPVLAVVAALAGLAAGFHRWRAVQAASPAPRAGDEALVESARRSR